MSGGVVLVGFSDGAAFAGGHGLTAGTVAALSDWLEDVTGATRQRAFAGETG